MDYATPQNTPKDHFQDDNKIVREAKKRAKDPQASLLDLGESREKLKGLLIGAKMDRRLPHKEASAVKSRIEARIIDEHGSLDYQFYKEPRSCLKTKTLLGTNPAPLPGGSNASKKTTQDQVIRSTKSGKNA